MELAINIRVAPWWLACYQAAIKSEMWTWADWLARNPSVEIEPC